MCMTLAARCVPPVAAQGAQPEAQPLRGMGHRFSQMNTDMDEFRMRAATEVAADPGNVGHAQRPRDGAAQVGRATVRTFQKRVLIGLLSAYLNATIRTA